MDYRSLLVHLEPDSTSSEARLQLAIALARECEAVLVGTAARMTRSPVIGDPYGIAAIDGQLLEAERMSIEEELARLERMFGEQTSGKDLRTDWRCAVSYPDAFIAREARAADLVIVGRGERQRSAAHQFPDPGDVLMRAGRPVLVVPPGASALGGKQIVLAWKDTREARRAVWDALPALGRAEAVHVVEVAEGDDLNAAAARLTDVVDHLSRHGVKAEAEVRTLRERSVADELILFAELKGADLIVAGGYGHARLREWAFGGVTGDLLRHCPKCCLLSH